MEGKVLLSCSSVTSKCKTQRLSIYKGGSQAQSVGSFQDGYVTTRPTGWEIFRHAWGQDKVVYGDQLRWPGNKNPPPQPEVTENSLSGSGVSLKSQWSRSHEVPSDVWDAGGHVLEPWPRWSKAETDSDRGQRSHREKFEKKIIRKKIWIWRGIMSSFGEGIVYDLCRASHSLRNFKEDKKNE